MTLREFLEHAQRERGQFSKAHPVLGPRGPVEIEYLVLEELGRVVGLSAGCDLDDELTPTVLRSLCAQFGIPPDDFHLDPDPDDE